MAEENQNDLLAYYQEQCEKLKKENMELSSKLATCEYAKKEAEENLHRIKNSLFWKLLKPFRMIRVACIRLGYYRSPKRIARKIRDKRIEKKAYKYFGTQSFPDEAERKRQSETVYEREIIFSILVPLYNTPEKFLREMIESGVIRYGAEFKKSMEDG